MISSIVIDVVEISIPFKKIEASIGASGSRASGTLYTYTNHPRTVRNVAFEIKTLNLRTSKPLKSLPSGKKE